MSAQGSVRKRIIVGLLAVAVLLAAAGVAAWIERTPLVAWYAMRSLARATDQDRALWADRVAGLGEGAEPAVFGCLAQGDDVVCRNAGAVLELWVVQVKPDDARAAPLAERMANAFDRCSPAGRRVVLETVAGWFQPNDAKPTEALVTACARLVTRSTEYKEPEPHATALDLCSVALDQAEDANDLLTAARGLVKCTLHDEPAGNRLRAVQLALHPSVDVLEEVADLLKDPSPEVRRAALLAVGPAGEDVVPANRILPHLHDEDAEVRRLCEEVLRNDRHLSPRRIKIGWCLYHPDPAQRLNVLDYLQRGADVEPGVWLRELSKDDSPSVRLAAARVMSQQKLVDVNDRLEQMANDDPSPTVSQMARLYQKWAKNGADR